MFITKDQFINAWNKFPPSKLEKFYFKYFSTKSENNKLSWLIFFILLIPFLIGYIATILNMSKNIIETSTIVFSFLLILFAIPRIYVWYLHNWRIKKIIKELNCEIDEYEIAVNTWGKYIK